MWEHLGNYLKLVEGGKFGDYEGIKRVTWDQIGHEG
jgi:hypothetical protein